MADTRCKPKPSGSRVLIPGRRRTAGPLSSAQTPTPTHSPGTGKDVGRGREPRRMRTGFGLGTASELPPLEGLSLPKASVSTSAKWGAAIPAWNGGAPRSWLGNAFVEWAVVAPNSCRARPAAHPPPAARGTSAKCTQTLSLPAADPPTPSSQNEAPTPRLARGWPLMSSPLGRSTAAALASRGLLPTPSSVLPLAFVPASPSALPEPVLSGSPSLFLLYGQQASPRSQGSAVPLA